MHTDEYEISLSRELEVCIKKVNALKKNLSRMEIKFNMTTEEFIVRFHHGEIPEDNKDFTTWMNDLHALRKWQSSMQQYEELFYFMKIGQGF